MWKFWKYPARIRHLENALQEEAGMVQYLARHGFEAGYKMAGGGDEWRENWFKSPTRKLLVSNGYISGSDTYR